MNSSSVVLPQSKARSQSKVRSLLLLSPFLFSFYLLPAEADEKPRVDSYPIPSSYSEGGSLDRKETSNDPNCTETDLKIAITPQSAQAKWQEPFEYQVTITNQGLCAIDSATVSTRLVSPSIPNLFWICNPVASCGSTFGSNDIHSTITLDPNASVTFSITVPPRSLQPGEPFLYQAEVTPRSSFTDVDLTNNTASLEALVEETPIPQDNIITPTLKHSLTGGGMSCSVAEGTISSGGGSLLQVFLMAGLLVVGKIVRGLRRSLP